MEISKGAYYIKIEGSDDNGDFEIQIQNDCSQLRINTEDGNVYIDINKQELIEIRDSINYIINQNKHALPKT